MQILFVTQDILVHSMSMLGQDNDLEYNAGVTDSLLGNKKMIFAYIFYQT